MRSSNVTPTDEMTRTLRVLAQLMNEDGVFGSEALYQAAALLDAQAAEIDRLRNLLSEKVIDSTRLRELVFRDGRLDVELEGGACALMAQAFGKQLFESGAENYIEASFESPAYPDHGRITVTVRREAGKTSHELRVIAEKQRDALAAELAAIKEQWIPVSERMPNAGQLLLVAGPRGAPDCGYYRTTAVMREDGIYDANGCWLSDATHWMPLPDAPQGELK
mgnify:CR=1 FL=1